MLVPLISFYICNLVLSSRNTFCWFKFTSMSDYLFAHADSIFCDYVLADNVSNVDLFSVFAYSLKSFMHSKWLSLWPHFIVYLNVV